MPSEQKNEAARLKLKTTIATAFREFPLNPDERWVMIRAAMRTSLATVSGEISLAFEDRKEVVTTVDLAYGANQLDEPEAVEDFLMGDWLTMIESECRSYAKSKEERS